MINNLNFTQEELEEHISEGLVTCRKHPDDDLYIYNYSNKTQYDRMWNHVTITTRGLILDAEYNVRARGFNKFFNYGEYAIPSFPDTKPLLQEKLDGSLGIIYESSNGYAVATRGSFGSEQAQWATVWLNNHYPRFYQPENTTTLCEIVYPENRKCVDYGDRAELVLLGAINNTTGADIHPYEIDWWDRSRAAIYQGDSLDHAIDLMSDPSMENQEGVVIAWYQENKPSQRLKFKTDEYLRLHKLIYGFSERQVWESLSTGKNVLEALDNVPDEFYDVVKSAVSHFETEYARIEAEAHAEFLKYKHISDRKEFAKAVQNCEYKHLLFRILDNHPLEEAIWKLLKI